MTIPSDRTARGSTAAQATLRVVAVLLLALGALPIASWIPSGLSDPAYARRWMEWGYGALICAGVAVVTAIFASQRPAGAGGRAWASAGRWLASHPMRADLLIAGGSFLVYLAIAQVVFDGRPLLIDEIIQVLQGRMYAAGNLWVPADRAREFFSVLHVVDSGARVYSQFPPGWAAMLAVGSLLHAEWAVGPVVGAIGVFAFARIVRRIHDGEPWLIAGGTLLFALAPFVAFQFASHMSHGPFVTLMLLAIALLWAARSGIAAFGIGPQAAAAIGGACAGLAFAVRPLDGLAFLVPTFAWLGWLTVRRALPVRHVAAAVSGCALPVLGVMLVNTATTGSPTLFGYEALWGASHGLGFHDAPWGEPHTPQRGLELLSLYVTRLNVYLFEAPFPSLLPVIAALFLAGPLSVIEALLLVMTSVHGALYFAYWHDGFYLGPRFVMPWVPVLILLSMRLVRRLRESDVPRAVRAGAAGAAVAGIAITGAISIPARVSQYRAGLGSMRTDYAAEAARAGVSNALVFVRESWGAQLISRLWALDVSRPATAALYAGVDACVLEHAITALERDGRAGMLAETALRPLLRDSSRVRSSSISPDTTERMLPGTIYDETCQRRVAADREGYVLYPPLLLDRESRNIYVRDFQERDTVLTKRYPDRPHYLLRRDGIDGAAPLVWTRLATGKQD